MKQQSSHGLTVQQVGTKVVGFMGLHKQLRSSASWERFRHLWHARSTIRRTSKALLS